MSHSRGNGTAKTLVVRGFVSEMSRRCLVDVSLGFADPFSAKFCCGTGVLKNTYKNAINFAINIKRLARRSRRVDGLFLCCVIATEYTRSTLRSTLPHFFG